MSQFDRKYTARDYEALREYITTEITSISNEWDDFSNSDVGTTLINVLATVSDILNINMDYRFLESFVTTVRQRSNAQNILALLNYKMSNYEAGKVRINLITTDLVGNDSPIDSTSNASVLLYAYSPIRAVSYTNTNINNLEFSFIDNVNIIPDTISTVVEGYLGKPLISRTSVSELSAYNEHNLGKVNLAEGTYRVFVDGVEWEEVPFLELLPDRSNSFAVNINSSDEVSIQFDSNIHTSSDITGDIIEIRYLSVYDETAGLVENITEGLILETVSAQNDILVDINGVSTNRKIRLEVEPVSTGGNPETIEQARVNAIGSWRANSSLGTIEDYNSASKQTDGVLDALSLDFHSYLNYPDLDPITVNYEVVTYIAPDIVNRDISSMTVSQSLVDQVQADLLVRRQAGIKVTVSNRYLAEEFDNIKFEIGVYDITIRSITLERVNIALREYLNHINWVFGRSLDIFELKVLIRDIDSNVNILATKIFVTKSQGTETELTTNIDVDIDAYIRFVNIEVI